MSSLSVIAARKPSSSMGPSQVNPTSATLPASTTATSQSSDTEVPLPSPALIAQHAESGVRAGRSSARPSKREQVIVACSACRRRRTKCDAARPSCGPCRGRGLDCNYDAEPGVTRTASLKRQRDDIQADLDIMQQIYDIIRKSPRTEADDTVQQIRQASDPSEVIHHIRRRRATATLTLLEPSSGAATQSLVRQPHNVEQVVTAQACHTCSERKSKCDEWRPRCGLCQHLDVKCEYKELPSSRKYGSTPKTLDASPRPKCKIDSVALGERTTTPDADLASVCSPDDASLSSPNPSRDNLGRGDCQPNGCSLPSSRPHLSVSHRVLLWPGVFSLIRESGIAVAASDFECIMRLGTPWLLKRETSNHLENLPCDVGLESIALGNGTVVFPSLTIQQVNEYSAAFFNTFNMVFPLLNPDIFMDEILARLLREGYKDDDPQGVLALLIFALGQLAIEGVFDRPVSVVQGDLSGFRGGTIERPPGLELFNEARRRIGLVATKCRLENVQIMLLQATYFEASARHTDFWSSVSAASMACIYLIRGQPIDWSSLYGDLVKRAYWVCVFHERLFDLDLKVASTGIESMEDYVPLPHFHGLMQRETESGIFASSDSSSLIAERHNDYKYHFCALISLSRLIRRAEDIIHGYECGVGEMEPLWQGTRAQRHFDAAASISYPARYSGPPSSLIHELIRQLESWRAALPRRLQWSDDDTFDFAKADSPDASSQKSFFSQLLNPRSRGASHNMGLAIAQLRTRFYHARFLIYRPFLYKALHLPELITTDDRAKCTLAIKSACLWALCLSPPKHMKHLMPHLFSWTQNFLAMLCILRLCRRNIGLEDICRGGGIGNEDIESSISLMIRWLEDLRKVDGIADWSMSVLRPLLDSTDHALS